MTSSPSSHDKLSSEEEDLKDRSNKRVKSNGSDNEEVIMDENMGETVRENTKPSFCDVVLAASGFKPNATEIIKMVQEELCPFMENEVQPPTNDKEFVMKPVIEVSFEEYEEWCRPWKNALIVNLVGKTVVFNL
ncbi:hypothetical protein RIF29_29679 [Crotalaria pallida]|uniref:Uncharacterized protein n=1 Tax=Crotalaria pallida TaxID=3830 RepID=A0AAN9HXN5_CROPI